MVLPIEYRRNPGTAGDTIENTPTLFAHLWRYKWYIFGAAVLAAAVSYGLSTLQDPVYRAEGTVLLNDPRSSGGIANEIGLVLDPRRYVRNQAEIVESPQVAQRAADNLNDGTTAGEVQDATVATPATDLDAITVAGTMLTATGAASIVDEVVQAYEEIVTEQIQKSVNGSIETLELSKAEAQGKIASLDAAIADDPGNSTLEAQRTAAINQLVTFDNRIELLATNAALYGSGVQLYVQPTVPTSPISPQPRRNASIAFVVAAFAVGAWAWWRGERHQLADDRARPARILDAPLLAAIPKYKYPRNSDSIPTDLPRESGAAEAYQFALSSLGFALERAQGTTVLITSVSPGDGKSTTAIHLAIAAAQDGRKVTLIDADERAQGLTKLAGLSGEIGISDLNGPDSIDNSTHEWTLPDGTTLHFIPAGTGVVGNTASFFRSHSLRSALTELLEKDEMVIIDSPPVMAAAETTDLAAAVDGIVFVVQEGASLRHLAEATERLTMTDTPIIGYIFNKTMVRSSDSSYGYGYGK